MNGGRKEIYGTTETIHKNPANEKFEVFLKLLRKEMKERWKEERKEME